MSGKQAEPTSGAVKDTIKTTGLDNSNSKLMDEIMKLVLCTMANEAPDDVAIIRWRSLLNPLDPENRGKEEKDVCINRWLEISQLKLEQAKVPKHQWVIVAAEKIPTNEYEQYDIWCKEKNRTKSDWAVFSEFLLREYTSTLARFNIYLRWYSLESPRNADQLENFYLRFLDLVKLLKWNPNEDNVVFEFMRKLPPALYPHIFANYTENNRPLLYTVYTTARAHFRAEALAATVMNNNAAVSMQTTQVREQSKRVSTTSRAHYSTRRPPSFEAVKSLCDNDFSVYQNRLDEDACVGCGGKNHRYTGCRQKLPKARKN